MDIKDLHEHFKSAQDEVKGLVERQSEEIKRVGSVTDETAQKLQAAEAKFDETTNDLAGRMEEAEKRLSRPEFGAAADQVKSAGQLFVESEEFKSAMQNGRRDSPSVEVKAITSDAASVGDVSTSQRVPGVYRDPADRMQHVRDLLDVQNTNSGSIEYFVDHSGFTNNAAAQNGELTAKAESDLALEAVVAPVRTIAHHVIASRQVLEDVAMLRSYIDGRLQYGLALEEDSQLLYGDGTGGTLTGIMNTSGIQDHGDRPAADDYITHVRRALTKARTSNYAPNGILINPEDWETVELTTSSDGHYIWAWYMSASTGAPTLWRIPVVESNAITAGDFLLGNWDMAATLWERSTMNIRTSESHADNFVKNGVAILGEKREALAVQRPKAFVKGSFAEAV